MTPEILFALVYTPIMSYLVAAPPGTSYKVCDAIQRRLIRYEPEQLDVALVEHDFVQEDIDRIDEELTAEELRQLPPVIESTEEYDERCRRDRIRRSLRARSSKMSYVDYANEWIVHNDYNRNYQKWNVSKHG